MDAKEVLNPTLYERLLRQFGEVRVTRVSEPFECRVVRDLADWPRLVVVRYGETYQVRCDYCRDRGFGLSVNHRYGTLHAGLGRPLDFLATCFADNCLKDRDNRDDLFERLGGADRLGEARVRTGTAAPADPARLPASFTRLDRLRPNHPACSGLAALGHDPDRLARVFGVGYCPAADVRVADEKVVVPVRSAGGLVGWLAAVFPWGGIRFLAAPGMAAGAQLYNSHRARDYPAVAVMPSPDWVWRVGTYAVAPLSSPSTEALARLLRKSLPKNDLLLVSTPERHAAVAVLTGRMMLLHRGKVTHVRLPHTASSASRGEITRLLKASAAERGIAVTFTRGA
jgi:hypothetical protein